MLTQQKPGQVFGLPSNCQGDLHSDFNFVPSILCLGVPKERPTAAPSAIDISPEQH